MDIQQHVREVRDNGYTVLRQVFSRERAAKALQITREWANRVDEFVSDKVPYLNRNQLMVYNLQSKDWFYVQFLFDAEPVLATMQALLNDEWYRAIPPDSPNYILRSYTARSSCDAMPLHIDSFVPYLGPHVISTQCCMILEDQTKANGCTFVVPGSHLAGAYATQDDIKRAVPVESEAGDVVCFDSRLWHGAFANETSGTRWSLLATFSRWWLKQYFDITRNLPQEFYQRMTPEQKSIMGFCSVPFRDEGDGIDFKQGYGDLPAHVADAVPPARDLVAGLRVKV